MKELEQIKARLSAATPGPWASYGDLGHEVYANTGSEDEEPTIAFDINRAQDAVFIAAAPTDVARLTGAVEAVLALVDKAYADSIYILPGGYPSRPVEASDLRAAIENALEGE